MFDIIQLKSKSLEELQAIAKEIALKQAQNIKEKAEDLYKFAIEKGTPVVEKAADDVRRQALKVVKDIQKKLEEKKEK